MSCTLTLIELFGAVNTVYYRPNIMQQQLVATINAKIKSTKQ